MVAPRSNDDGTAVRGLIWAAVGFGAVSNLLMLTGPVFMLQIYDRVLPSRSVETLMVLLGLVAFLHVVMAEIDGARGQLLARIGGRLRHRLEERLFLASLRSGSRDPPDQRHAVALRDLDAIDRLAGSGLAGAVLDLPWMPVFVILLALVHPLLGLLAVSGALALVALAVRGHYCQSRPLAQAQVEGAAADRLWSTLREARSDSSAMMSPGLLARWRRTRGRALVLALAGADHNARLTARARAFRLFLQSAMLAAGAWLVLHDSLTPGLMVASSILLGRALAPVEQLAAQGGPLVAGLTSVRRLRSVLRCEPAAASADPVEPGASLTLRSLAVTGDDRGLLILRLTGFDLVPGRALAVIGPTGSGKTVLAQVLAGALLPIAGTLRLGSVPLARLPASAIGYAPQRLVFCAATIAETIARHDPGANTATIVHSASLVGANQAVEALPDGYRTLLDSGGARLSTGLLQRIGLARALYGRPALVVLDDPFAHLDTDGVSALIGALRALKAAGVLIVLTANRPAEIAECDDLLVLENGVQVAFGPRERVLRDLASKGTNAMPRVAGTAS